LPRNVARYPFDGINDVVIIKIESPVRYLETN
jgi:hypothetical protein